MLPNFLPRYTIAQQLSESAKAELFAELRQRYPQVLRGIWKALRLQQR